MVKTNAGIILISKKALLELLYFPNGVLLNIRVNPEKWNPDEIEITLEHPDLPEVREGVGCRQGRVGENARGGK